MNDYIPDKELEQTALLFICNYNKSRKWLTDKEFLAYFVQENKEAIMKFYRGKNENRGI